MCLCLLGMTACDKTDPTTVDYNGYSYADLQGYVQGTVSTLLSLTEEDRVSYLTSGQEMTVNLITRWDEATAESGSFVAYGEFDVVKAGKTLTAEQAIEFEKGNEVMVTFVYHYSTMELTDIAIDPIQSISEKMSTAGMNTIMGMGTVFVILILISLIIYAFRIIPYLTERKKNIPAVEVKSDTFVEQITRREQIQDDLELVAVISAAIAAATGTSTNDFVVRSIKRR